jgi:hypothetical protein
MHRYHRAFLAGAVGLAGSLFLASGSAFAAGPSWTVSAAISGGLKNPRGIVFDAAGNMYIAEAGLPGDGVGVTNTGAVDKYKLASHAWSRSWSKAFNSAFTHAHGAPETIGPSGMSARGNKILMIMGLNHHEVPAQVGPQIGHLYQLNPATGAATDRGNIGDQNWTWTNGHKDLAPNDFPDSNPYGVLIARSEEEGSQSTVFVVDAGANTVSRVGADGVPHVIAYIPNETPVTGLPTTDSTPTCAAQGPDGALYVGTLHLARNFADPNQGRSQVWRIELDEDEGIFTAAKVWATGLTTITSCAFDRSGNFWATEMFKSNAFGPPGDVVRIRLADPAHPQHIGGGQIPFPAGIAQGRDGGIYVTVNGAFSTTADGKVLRLSH